MALYVTEFGGFLSGRPYPYLKEPPITQTVFSSGSTLASTATLNAGTAFVSIYASANAYALFTGSSGSTTVATSTNSELFPAASPIVIRAVVPGSRYTVLST